MENSAVLNKTNSCLSKQVLLSEVVENSNEGVENSLEIKSVIDAYARNFKFVESDVNDGVSVKAKDGSLIVELPKKQHPN